MLPTRPIQVYLVEDDAALRHDFARVIEAAPQMHLCGQCGSLREARLDLDRLGEIDVLLLDLRLPDGDGAQLIPLLARRYPQARTLILSMFCDERRVMGALSAGAQGYLLKDATDEALTNAILQVMQGNAPLSPRVARHLLPKPMKAVPPAQTVNPSHVLTPREAEILIQIARGQTGAQVADQMGLSLHTVSTHLRNCYTKLKVRNRLQAINRAKETGQIG
jgi:DNA-binding NarL/FixJ family response regulator